PRTSIGVGVGITTTSRTVPRNPATATDQKLSPTGALPAPRRSTWTRSIERPAPTAQPFTAPGLSRRDSVPKPRVARFTTFYVVYTFHVACDVRPGSRFRAHSTLKRLQPSNLYRTV